MDARSRVILVLFSLLITAFQGCMTMEALTKGEDSFFHAENEGVITSPCIVFMLDGSAQRFSEGETKFVSSEGTTMIVGHLESAERDTLRRILLNDVRFIAPLHPITIYTRDSISIESSLGQWYLIVSHGTIDTLSAEGTRIDGITGKTTNGTFAVSLANITGAKGPGKTNIVGVQVALTLAAVGLLAYGIFLIVSGVGKGISKYY